jgi:hypothetical protein
MTPLVVLEVLNRVWVILAGELVLRDVMPEVAVYLVKKGLAAFCFNSHPLPDIIVFFPADDGQRLEGPFKEFDRINRLQFFKGLYIPPVVALARRESDYA